MSSNAEAFASELQGNFENFLTMLLFAGSNIHSKPWCVTHYKIFKSCLFIDIYYFFSVPPAITSSETHYKVDFGNSLEVSCEATGKPQPDIMWQYEVRNITIKLLILENLEDLFSHYVCYVYGQMTIKYFYVYFSL